ncbi:MAG: tryptophan-rich sensory protein [Mesorhizobium sp.]|nr:tryptophan-rich sensory protein [Mesorhizobium sp.]
MPDLSLLVFIGICVATAMTGILFKPGDWYKALDKPSWTPPDWLFGPVWSALYLMIAVAGWLVWTTLGMSGLLVLWGVNLVLNAMWSWLFFGVRRMDLAFVDVVMMWLAIAAFIVLASATVPLAALLFVPYLIWVTIASALNLSVWRRNPQAA